SSLANAARSQHDRPEPIGLRGLARTGLGARACNASSIADVHGPDVGLVAVARYGAGHGRERARRAVLTRATARRARHAAVVAVLVAARRRATPADTRGAGLEERAGEAIGVRVAALAALAPDAVRVVAPTVDVGLVPVLVEVVAARGAAEAERTHV